MRGHGIVNGMEVEMGGDVVAGHIVGRVLYGAEFVNIVALGHNDHAAGVLARGAADTGTAHG